MTITYNFVFNEETIFKSWKPPQIDDLGRPLHGNRLCVVGLVNDIVGALELGGLLAQHADGALGLIQLVVVLPQQFPLLAKQRVRVL